MTVLMITIPVSLLLGAIGLAAFLWSLRSGQYRDLEGDAARILFSDDDAPPEDREPRGEGPGREDDADEDGPRTG
ncbi:MAG TPA: cbb3-type cytochrome oxidase assembly protein CcoS [Paracoccaceae bacterium]|nr:cbb3-type cytochrome oxidase assembly protein CcoS [Paracoccaceae bacterium]